MAKQHEQSAISEHSERKGTKALTPEARTKARSVKVTGQYTINHDSGRTPEERRAQHFAANGHKASTDAQGLAQAAAEEGRSTKELSTADQPELGTGILASQQAEAQAQQ